MKHYSLYFTSNKTICHSNRHLYGHTNNYKTVSTTYIKRCLEMYKEDNPRDFEIVDNWKEE